MATRYRPPSKAPRTAWAIHIDRYMRENGLSQTQAFELVQDALGLGPKSRAAFLPFLDKREPNEDEAQALASVFGWPTPEEDHPAGPTPDLAQALVMLATELTALREERQQLVARVSDLELAFAALAERTRLDLGPGAGHAPGARGSQAG